MKKRNIIFPPLLLTLTTMPFSVSALTVSGTVVDETGEPLIGATIKDSNTKKAVITDINGNFTLNSENKSNLEISYIGYKTQTVTPQEKLNITLVEDSKVLGEVVETGKADITGKECVTKEQAIQAAEEEARKQHTKSEEIQEAIRENSRRPAYLVDEHANKEAKGKYKKVGTEWICVPNECIQDYKLEGTICVKYQCSQSELKAANATDGTWDKNLKACIPVCDEANGFTRNIRNICERTKCSKSEIDNLKKQDKNVNTGKLEEGQCVPVCKDKYHLENGKCEKNKCDKEEEDWDGKKCVKVRCTTDELNEIHTIQKYAKWDEAKKICIATECPDKKNFKLSDGKCITNDCPTKELEKINATTGYMQDGKCIPETCIKDYEIDPNTHACTNKKALEEKQKAYDKAHETEQSFENRALTAATTAATGIGGMQLMQGLAEQSSDKDAAADMAAYIETMRCTYGDGKQVKAGPDEIELPGANDSELMKLRSEYLALAADLKERKEALGMKPGIESETILDRSATGLYDDENIGISGGNYGSLYRAQMLNSESDQSKIADEKSISSNRVKGGAIAAGAGVVVGVAGNSLINGKLGEMLKSKKSKTEAEKLLEKEADALKDLQSCLKDAGVKDTDKLEFANFYPSVLTVKNIKCKKIKLKANNVKASDIFADSTDEDEIFNSMNKYFDTETISKFVGFSKTEKEDNIKNEIKSAISEKQKEIAETKKRDTEPKESKSKDSSSGIDINNILDNVDINDIKEKAGSLLG